MVNYRLLALDLDETVLTKDKQITEETKQWVSRAVDSGVFVVLATGRGIQKIEDIRSDLNLNSPMVLLNGSEVWKKPGQLMKRYYINRDDIQLLHSIAVDAGAFYWGYSVESLTGSRGWTKEMFNRDWMKFGIRHDDPKIIKQISEQVMNSFTIEVTTSSPGRLEFSYKDISKETGIREVCHYLNIGMESVMAIGDNLNDFDLIQSAGMGIAMGNADDRLKKAADEITDTNEKDGVAKAIQRYLF